MNEKELREECGADDGKLYPEDPDECPECRGVLRTVTDNNYGADADGRRGITVHWLECRSCGYEPGEG